MNFDRLNTFQAAAADLNFTQAARRLHLSQPAVSQQIRELEEDLGVTLFERRGRGLLLTPAGERLRMLTHPVLRELNQIRSEMTTFGELPQGVLRVGASNTPGIYLLPSALGKFSTLFPGVRLTMDVADVESLLHAMHGGELDLALVEEDPSAGRLRGLDKIAMLEDELVLIAPIDHPWAAREDIALDELPDAEFIFRPISSETRQLIHDRLAEAGLDPNRLRTRFELGNTEGIKRAVMAGLGVGFVSRFAIDMEQRAGLLAEVRVKGFSLTRTLWLIRPASDRLAPHQARFGEMLLEGGWLPGRTVAPGELPLRRTAEEEVCP